MSSEPPSMPPPSGNEPPPPPPPSYNPPPPPSMGPPPPPMSMGAGYGAAQPRNSGMAIAALVVGIVAAVGIFCYGIVGLILGVVAVFLGLRARREIKASGGAIGGYGLAQAGWIIGLCAAILGAIYFIVVVGFIAIVGITGIHFTPSP